MDEARLRELFDSDTDNARVKSSEHKYLTEHLSDYIRRLKSRGTTRRGLYEEYSRERPGGYSYCTFCLYLRREKEVRIPVGRINHIAGDQIILKHTEALNERKMYNRTYSRKERFMEIEKDRLHPLPTTRYISKCRKTATVMRNSYVALNSHYYSVPKEYFNKPICTFLF